MKHIRNCQPCRERKLKCDRQRPVCVNCKTRDIASSCSFSTSPRSSQKRRLSASEEDEDYPLDPALTSRPDDEAVRHTSTAPSVHSLLQLLPDKKQLDKVVRAYLEHLSWAFYVIRLDDLKQRVALAVDLRSQQLQGDRLIGDKSVHLRDSLLVLVALCGATAPFLEQDEKQSRTIYRRYFEAVKAILTPATLYNNPGVDHVRALTLMVAGLGPLDGHSVAAGYLKDAIYVAKVLRLHKEPSASFNLEEKQDRLRLYFTLCKADWFSAASLQRDFYSIHEDPIGFPSLFGNPNHRSQLLNQSETLLFSLASLSRRTVDCASMRQNEALNETYKIQNELAAFEARLPDPSFDRMGTSTIPIDRLAYMRMNIELRRFFLHKPYYASGWYNDLYAPSRDITFRSAIRCIKAITNIFDSTMKAAQNRRGDIGLLPATTFGGVWFFTYNVLQCALLLVNHLSLLEEVQEANWNAEEEASSAKTSLEKMKKMLIQLSSESVIARDGLKTLFDPSGEIATKSRRKLNEKIGIESMEGGKVETEQSSTGMVTPDWGSSTHLDDGMTQFLQFLSGHSEDMTSFDAIVQSPEDEQFWSLLSQHIDF